MIRLNNSTCAKVSANKIYLNFSYVISVIDTYGNMDMVRVGAIEEEDKLSSRYHILLFIV